MIKIFSWLCDIKKKTNCPTEIMQESKCFLLTTVKIATNTGQSSLENKRHSSRIKKFSLIHVFQVCVNVDSTEARENALLW